MKILITGGSGFCGTVLVRQLLEAGHGVTIFDKAPSATYPDLVRLGDVRDADALRNAVNGHDIVYHLAAEHRDDVRPLSPYDDVNVGGARNLVAAAESESASRIVFTSSVAVYPLDSPMPDESSPPGPFNRYGKSKLDSEMVFNEWAREDSSRTLVTVRPCVIFGESNRGNVYNLLHQISQRRFVMVGGGSNRKSMGYVGNLIHFLVHCLGIGPGRHLYNYADKPDLTMRSLVSIARAALGRSPDGIVRVPRWGALSVGYAFDALARLAGKPFTISSIRVRKFCAETTVAAERLEATGFRRPFTLEEGLQRTIRAEFNGG